MDCVQCVHFVTIDYSRFCVYCGREIEVYDKYMDQDYERFSLSKEQTFKYQEFHDVCKYNRRLVNTLTNNSKGYQYKLLPCMFRDMCKKIPNPFSWKSVWDVYKEFGLDTVWRGFIYTFSGNEPPGPTEQEFNYIVEILYDLHRLQEKYKWNGTSKVGFFYMLMKLRQIKGKDTSWIPIKLTSSKLHEYEKKWEIICKEKNIKFIPHKAHKKTTMTPSGKEKIKEVFEIPDVWWPKDEVIRRLSIDIHLKRQRNREAVKERDLRESKISPYWS